MIEEVLFQALTGRDRVRGSVSIDKSWSKEQIRRSFLF